MFSSMKCMNFSFLNFQTLSTLSTFPESSGIIAWRETFMGAFCPLNVESSRVAMHASCPDVEYQKSWYVISVRDLNLVYVHWLNLFRKDVWDDYTFRLYRANLSPGGGLKARGSLLSNIRKDKTLAQRNSSLAKKKLADANSGQLKKPTPVSQDTVNAVSPLNPLTFSLVLHDSNKRLCWHLSLWRKKKPSWTCCMN